MNLPPASVRATCVAGLVPLFVRTNLSRVVIAGTSGSGKTQFASELAKHHGCTHIELDALLSEPAPPSWRQRTEDETAELLAPHLAQEHWVADGNNSRQCSAIWQHATCVIWLRYSLPVLFGRALRHTAQRISSGKRTHGGNVESFRTAFLSSNGIPWWVLRTHRQSTREYTDVTLRRRLPFVELTSPALADEFLKRVGSEAASQGETAGNSHRRRARAPQPQAAPPSHF